MEAEVPVEEKRSIPVSVVETDSLKGIKWLMGSSLGFQENSWSKIAQNWTSQQVKVRKLPLEAGQPTQIQLSSEGELYRSASDWGESAPDTELKLQGLLGMQF